MAETETPDDNKSMGLIAGMGVADGVSPSSDALVSGIISGGIFSGVTAVVTGEFEVL